MISSGWGTWIRTKIDGVRVSSAAVVSARFFYKMGSDVDPRTTDPVAGTDATNSTGAAAERMLTSPEASDVLRLSEVLVGEGTDARRRAALRENGPLNSVPRKRVAAMDAVSSALVDEQQ